MYVSMSGCPPTTGVTLLVWCISLHFYCYDKSSQGPASFRRVYMDRPFQRVRIYYGGKTSGIVAQDAESSHLDPQVGSRSRTLGIA